MRIAYSYVRFSTPEQARGDSLRRQVILAEEYARQHGLVLDRKLKLRDLGVSSFRGANAATGALRTFLDAITQKKVVPGSVLLVENLDRLSRDQIGKSFTLLLNIINAGVEVVTLIDGMRYSEKTINENITALITGLVTFHRSHEESALKARRLGAAWEHKRKLCAERKLTARAPAWLKLSVDRRSFEVIPDRGDLIRRIFTMTLDGHGKRAVVRKLNVEKIKTWGRGNGWHDSYVQKILHNRAVIGEYQPHRLINGNREPTGDPIIDYFPVVVDEATFAKVQHRPLRLPGGPVGKTVTNLFTQLAYCGFTDLPLHYIDKGTRTRGKGQWKYLINNGQRIGRPSSSIHYPTFEQAFLAYVRHLDWQEILEADKPNGRLKELNNQIAHAQAQRQDTSARLKKLMRAIEDEDSPPKAILGRIQELETNQENLSISIQDLLIRQRIEQSQTKNAAEESASLAELAGKASDYNTRIRLREEIRRKIKRIKIWGKFAAPTPSILGRGIRFNLNPGFEIEFVNGVTRHVNLENFQSLRAKYTLEISGEQVPGYKEPSEETNPRPFSQRPSKSNASVRKKRKNIKTTLA